MCAVLLNGGRAFPVANNQLPINPGQFVPKIMKICQMVKKMDLVKGVKGMVPINSSYPEQFVPKIINICQEFIRGVWLTFPPRGGFRS